MSGPNGFLSRPLDLSGLQIDLPADAPAPAETAEAPVDAGPAKSTAAAPGGNVAGGAPEAQQASSSRREAESVTKKKAGRSRRKSLVSLDDAGGKPTILGG